MTSTLVKPIPQPKFDSRIYSLAYPLGGGNSGVLKRGSMVWADAIFGYSEPCRMQFLYNPSTVTATYSMTTDTSTQAGMIFPTAYDNTELRVPLSQSVEWSLLFDRTYELWQQYDSKGNPLQDLGPNGNNPAVIGCLADIRQMQQFTGMNVGYWTTNTGDQGNISADFYKQQGIMQPAFSYVFFGGGQNSYKNSLWYYGYVSEWDVTITHWTQFMVPMRCVINIDFTLMPVQNINAAPATANTDWSLGTVEKATGTSPPPALGVST